MSFFSKRSSVKTIALSLGLLTMLAINHYQRYLSFDNTPDTGFVLPGLYALLVFAIFFFFLRQLICYPKNCILKTDAQILLCGIGYVCLFLSFLVFIRNHTAGVKWIFFILFILWVGDSAAYCVGKIIGRRKLWPAVSPNKTREGAIGGVMASLLAGFVCKAFFLPELPGVHCFFLTLAIALSGQLGDLCESSLKRIRGVKDTGSLFPGHGGILDRIDSLLLASPVAYYYIVLLLH